MYLVAKHLIYPVRSEHTEHYNVHSAPFAHLVAEHLLHPVRQLLEIRLRGLRLHTAPPTNQRLVWGNILQGFGQSDGGVRNMINLEYTPSS